MVISENFLTMNSWGEILRKKRLEIGLTQRELAERIGVDISYISKMENGRVPAPSNATIHRLSKTLGGSAKALLDAAGWQKGDAMEGNRTNAKGARSFSVCPWIDVIAFGFDYRISSDSYYSHLVHGIQMEAHQGARSKISFSSCTEQRFKPAELEHFSQRDGLLLTGTFNHYMAAFEQIVALGIPVVLAGRRIAGRRFNYVLSDYYPGCQELVDYLYDLNIRRFGWLGRREYMPHADFRLDMVRGRLASKGFHIAAKDCLLMERGDSDAPALLAVLRERFSEGDLPEVLVCSNGSFVPFVLQAMALAGLKCPDDLSVVCFDNHSFVRFCHPEPTRMATFPDEIGRQAYRLMLDVISSGEDGEESTLSIMVPTRLIEGGSVKPLRLKEADPP